VTIAAGSEGDGPGTAGGLAPNDTNDPGARTDVEDVVCLGDEHARGVETLCVGESR
jgi:hypothetical protein